MRKIGRCLRVTAVFLTALTGAWLSLADGSMDPGLAVKAIQNGLERSPGHHVAGVLEVVGAPKCEDPKVSSTCVNEMRLEEVLSSAGGRFEQGSVLVVVGHGAVGARYVGFLVPVEGRPGTYGATFLSASSDPEARNGLRVALEQAGL